jgi:hypothetical protein
VDLVAAQTRGGRRVDDPDQGDHAAQDHQAAADGEAPAVGVGGGRLDRGVELRAAGRAARQRALLDLGDRRAVRGGELAAGQPLVERGAELRRHHRADRGDRQQARDPRDRVVGAARHARVVLRDRAQHGVGQRRDGHREAEGEQQHARQQVRDVLHLGVEPAHPEQAEPAHDRAGSHQRPRADAVRQRAEAA